MSHARRCSVMMLASCVAISSAVAHPIHTTMTAISWRNGQVTLSIRAFADDLSASVATFVGKTPPPDWAVSEAEVSRYVASRVELRDARGAPQSMHLCGVQRTGELYQVCLRFDATNVRGLQMENRLLTERHDDQVNIVQVDVKGLRKTLLFTKRTRAQPLVD